jgi:methyl-accepting chemotaxis protein
LNSYLSIKTSKNAYVLGNFFVLHSIQKRLVFFVIFCALLIAGSAGVVFALLPLELIQSSNGAWLMGLLLTSLLLVLFTGLVVLRPILKGLASVQLRLEHRATQSDLGQNLPATLPTELEQLTRSIAKHLNHQKVAMAHVDTAMAALQRGRLDLAISSTMPASTDDEGARMLGSVQSGLGHLQALIAELHHFIQQVYTDVHNTSVSGSSIASTWRADPLLGPALEKLDAGHLNLLKIVHDMTLVVENSSITLADLSWQANTINQEMKALANKGAQVSDSSQSLAHNSSRVSKDAASVAQLAQLARENSQLGQVELNNTIESMRHMGARTQMVSSSITDLQVSSQKIEHVVRLIQDIANKINMLSLNAAIEAARAGEHGKGFAVVSDEVRKLAEKTFEATQEIDASVSGITRQTGLAVSSMNELLSDVQANVTQIEQVGQRLTGILNSSSELSEQMDGIVQASSHSAHEVNTISNYLGEIQDELASFGLRIESQERQTMGLTELSEGFYEKLVELNLETVHRRMFAVARAAADAVQAVFEEGVANGKISQADLLSVEHAAIVNTNPQKYSSRFDTFTDQVLPAIQETVLQSCPELVFAICTNKRGYVPTHNDKFAKPLTGRYDVDLVSSRSKRIFSDRTGSRCGSHTQKLLLQTYKRDTGEIMHDLSVPIMVAGQHWGGFRMGYKAQ